MHLRRIACFLLGGWLIGSVLMVFVTSSNYDAAEDVLRSPPPEAAKLLANLPGEQGRMLLFFIANEIGRGYIPIWQSIQVLLGLATAVTLFLERRTRYYSAGVGLMLLLVLFEWLVVLPQLDWLGRSVDFVPWRDDSSARNQYWNLRAVYLGVETVKLLVGALVVAALIVMRTRSRGLHGEIGKAELNEAAAWPRTGRSLGGSS